MLYKVHDPFRKNGEHLWEPMARFSGVSQKCLGPNGNVDLKDMEKVL